MPQRPVGLDIKLSQPIMGLNYPLVKSSTQKYRLRNSLEVTENFCFYQESQIGARFSVQFLK